MERGSERGKISVRQRKRVKFRLFSPGGEFDQVVVHHLLQLFLAISSSVMLVYTLMFPMHPEVVNEGLDSIPPREDDPV